MPFHAVIKPRFGDSVSVMTDQSGRPALFVDIGAGTLVSVQVDDEPGSRELAVLFAQNLSRSALRFAELCEADMHDAEGGRAS
ncbi:MAG: hypothetical protein JOZ47_08815 [Kutzneria sp.]|nr:hypothetical protein [Kutzneria sp.]